VEPRGTGAEEPKSPKSLKLSLRGSVERQAQRRLYWLDKPRIGSVWTDRMVRTEQSTRRYSSLKYFWELVWAALYE
jgi:hypothetical protein